MIEGMTHDKQAVLQTEQNVTPSYSISSKDSGTKQCLFMSAIFNILFIGTIIIGAIFLFRNHNTICHLKVEKQIAHFHALGIGYHVDGCDVTPDITKHSARKQKPHKEDAYAKRYGGKQHPGTEDYDLTAEYMAHPRPGPTPPQHGGDHYSGKKPGPRPGPPHHGGDKPGPPHHGGDKPGPPHHGGDKPDPPHHGGDKPHPPHHSGDKPGPPNSGGGGRNPGNKPDSRPEFPRPEQKPGPKKDGGKRTEGHRPEYNLHPYPEKPQDRAGAADLESEYIEPKTYADTADTMGNIIADMSNGQIDPVDNNMETLSEKDNFLGSLLGDLGNDMQNGIDDEIKV